MKNSEIINGIRHLIGLGNIEDAFEQMENCPDIWVNADSRDTILQIKSNFNLLKKQSIKGVLSHERYNTELNTIIDNLLIYLKNIDDVINYHEHYLKSGELKSENIQYLKIPRYLGAKKFLDKIKVFFSNSRSRKFSLYLVKTKQYWMIDCPEHIRVETLSKYLADELFPSLKEQHFIWRLESRSIRIPNVVTVQNSGLKESNVLNLTAEYKHHEELWGDDMKKRIVMQDFQELPNSKTIPKNGNQIG
jgi:hypothetical protein